MLTPFKELIPPLHPDEYALLEQSLLSEGCREAIIVWGDILIDGHNRYELCNKHGIAYETKHKEFADADEAKMWIYTNQMGRRNLTPLEKVSIAERMARPAIEAAARANMVLGAEMTNTGLSELTKAETHTRTELAKLAGVSSGTYYKGTQILEKAPQETIQKVMRGEESIDRAYQSIRRQEKLDAVKDIELTASTTGTGIDIYTTVNKYSIIYADPPWQYWEGGQKNQSLHYPTMSIDEICDMPVCDIAATNAILFLWITYPILFDAQRVIRAWGFTYSTAGFVWIKKNANAETNFFGCGAWTRANSELCLIATRGRVTRIDASISQVIEEERGKHSQKPDIVRDKIERLVGKLPRIELFARESAPGWDVWGNQV